VNELSEFENLTAGEDLHSGRWVLGRISLSAPAELPKPPAAQRTCGGKPTNHPEGAVFFLRRCEEHLPSGCRDQEIQALPPPRVPLVFQGCAWRYRSAPVSTGAPWECQVRPASNKRMPGAPGIPRAHLTSQGAPAIPRVGKRPCDYQLSFDSLAVTTRGGDRSAHGSSTGGLAGRHQC
jgi:hypothetical protein